MTLNAWLKVIAAGSRAECRGTIARLALLSSSPDCSAPALHSGFALSLSPSFWVPLSRAFFSFPWILTPPPPKVAWLPQSARRPREGVTDWFCPVAPSIALRPAAWTSVLRIYLCDSVLADGASTRLCLALWAKHMLRPPVSCVSLLASKCPPPRGILSIKQDSVFKVLRNPDSRLALSGYEVWLFFL